MRKTTAQVSIEFAFCMIVILALIYGIVMAFRWAGVSLAQRRVAHEKVLTKNIHDSWDYENSPEKQLSKDFYIPSEEDGLDFVLPKNILTGE